MTSQTSATAHSDTFARENLPPEDRWPRFDFSLPNPDGVTNSIDYPERINCAVELLDRMVESGHGDSPCIIFNDETTTYRELLEQANRIANVLVDDLGLEPGNRVLLRGPNNLWLSACWYAVLKAGGVVVTTMPLLRSGELKYVLEKAQVNLCLCDHRFLDDLATGIARAEGPAAVLVSYGDLKTTNSPAARRASRRPSTTSTPSGRMSPSLPSPREALDRPKAVSTSTGMCY